MTRTPPTNLPIRPLGHMVAGGVAWMTAQAIATKAILLVGQIILARLLAKSDFGLVGMALIVSAMASTIQYAGINEVLIQRFGKFRRWATPAFWITITFGLLAAALMCFAAPFVAAAFDAPRLPGLIFVLAACAPLDAFAAVPTIWLQGHMRFTLLAKLEIARVALVTGISISMASLGFGAYSFVVPQLIVAGLRAAVIWSISHPQIQLRLQLSRWRYFLKDGALITGIAIVNTLVAQGDYIMLGRLHRDNKEVLGVYFFAFGLSAQTISILVSRLSDVLFPALSRLRDEPLRQTQAFVRASRLLALIAFPACMLQAALAGPILRILFGVKWVAAIPVFAVLSIAMMSEIVAGPAWSLLRAQGRFTAAFRFSLIRAVVFLAVVFVAAKIGAALSVAIAVAMFLWIVGPSLSYLTVHPLGISAGALVRTYLLPLALSLAALGPALLLGWLGRTLGLNDLPFAVIITGCDVALYVAIFRWAAPEEFAAIIQHLRPLLSRSKPA